MAYAVDDGFRLTVLDGAALALTFQTGLDEGGYLPDQNILADAVFKDDCCGDIEEIVLTSGFNDLPSTP